jgi:hypothetical protein
LWHLQDLWRSMQFNADLLEEKVIAKLTDNHVRVQSREQYMSFLQMMEAEGVKNKGNVSLITEAIGEMNYLHQSLLTVFQDKDYMALYDSSKEMIAELKNKSESPYLSPIETCLNGIYGVIMLKLQQKRVSEETKQAIEQFTQLLNLLSSRYRDMCEGKPLFSQKINN